MLPCSDTVAVLRTVRRSLHKNASCSWAGAGSGGAAPAQPSAHRCSGACPVSECSRRWQAVSEQAFYLSPSLGLSGQSGPSGSRRSGELAGPLSGLLAGAALKVAEKFFLVA